MKASEIRDRFLKFFINRGHQVIASASLVPENDASVLFTTAGMQPLSPYLLGESHPAGNRLVSVQKCVRTVDIEAIGDKTHLTFFEMLGNWSLGDYFKTESINWSFELLTNPTEGFGLDPKRLYVTVFAGDNNAPCDEESSRQWQALGIPKSRIYFLPDNWWSPGDNGPCGPDTEIFYDLTDQGLGEMSLEEFKSADDKQHLVEVWNNVFMEYEKKDGQVIGRLKKKNVDTGAGLERLTAIIQKVDSVFETDLLAPLIEMARTLATKPDDRDLKIIVDHLRSAVFIIADGVSPSNTDRGYVLRRLIRRALVAAHHSQLKSGAFSSLALKIIDSQSPSYPNLKELSSLIINCLTEEEAKFSQTLKRGLKEFEKFASRGQIEAADVFLLYSSYGFPIELTLALAADRNLPVDKAGLKDKKEAHKKVSAVGVNKKFRGGLAGTDEKTINYHTATHLLQAALRQILGPEVYQRGSNITPDRLRFDFSHSQKLTDEQKQAVEKLVNQAIEANWPVKEIQMSKDDARSINALGIFNDKYGDQVKVYYIGEDLSSAWSKEFCGGPHASRTGQLGKFKIIKEESVADGVRRIKAILE